MLVKYITWYDFSERFTLVNGNVVFISVTFTIIESILATTSSLLTGRLHSSLQMLQATLTYRILLFFGGERRRVISLQKDRFPILQPVNRVYWKLLFTCVTSWLRWHFDKTVHHKPGRRPWEKLTNHLWHLNVENCDKKVTGFPKLTGRTPQIVKWAYSSLSINEIMIREIC